jgi:DNA polymerase III subunit epsilon
MMREIVLDTETTGLSPADGHRIVEIGAIELVNHIPSGKTFHRYLNPGREMPKEAEAVHGLTSKFLMDKPRFEAVAAEFLAFIGEAGLVIHNASFDMAFLNAELAAAKHPHLAFDRVTDTLALARKKYPMAPNSLDALCKRYGIDTARRDKHGALVDSELLAEVYLELIGGKQKTLGLARSASRPMRRKARARGQGRWRKGSRHGKSKTTRIS